MEKQPQGSSRVSLENRKDRRSIPFPRDRGIPHIPSQYGSGTASRGSFHNGLEPKMVHCCMSWTVMEVENVLNALDDAIFPGIYGNMLDVVARHYCRCMRQIPFVAKLPFAGSVRRQPWHRGVRRSEEHTSELQSPC